MDLSKEFKDWITEKISSALDDYTDESVYGADLAYKLFEGENIDGSVTYSTYAAKEFIKDHWDDAGEIAQYLKENLDMTINPFDEPEKFHVVMLLQGAQEILNESEYISDNWNNEIDLTSENIKMIKDEIGLDVADEEEKEAIISVLFIQPQKPPELITVNNDLSSLQDLVDGSIEVVYPYEDQVGLICNEEGKVKSLPLNRALYDESGAIYDIIAGNLVIAGLGEDDFISLNDDLASKYFNKFVHPESFANINGQITAIKEPVGESDISLNNEVTESKDAAVALADQQITNNTQEKGR